MVLLCSLLFGAALLLRRLRVHPSTDPATEPVTEPVTGPATGPVTRSPWLLIPATMATGLLTELGAWTDAWAAAERHPALVHPQLVWDLLLTAPLYAGWGLAWVLLRRRWAFRLSEMVVVQALLGIVVEQDGAVLLAGLRTLPTGLIGWAFVMTVYGSVIGLAALWSGTTGGGGRAGSGWLRLPVAAVVVMILGLGLTLLCAALLSAAGAPPPPPRPIRSHPWW